MAKMNIKKGDKVKVLAGKDRGAVSTVIRAFPAQQRVMVEKVNMVTKAQHPTQQNPQGGLIKLEAPITFPTCSWSALSAMKPLA